MIIKPYRDLYDAIGEAAFKEAVAFFRSRGVSSLGCRAKRRLWSFMAMGRKDGPTVITCWVELTASLRWCRNRPVRSSRCTNTERRSSPTND